MGGLTPYVTIVSTFTSTWHHSHDECSQAFPIFHSSFTPVYYCECKREVKMGRPGNKAKFIHSSYLRQLCYHRTYCLLKKIYQALVFADPLQHVRVEFWDFLFCNKYLQCICGIYIWSVAQRPYMLTKTFNEKRFSPVGKNHKNHKNFYFNQTKFLLCGSFENSFVLSPWD